MPMEDFKNCQEGSMNSYNPKADEEEAKRRAAADQMKHNLLTQILSQAARARLSTLLLAKPEKGRKVENLLLSLAQRGEIRSKLEESDFVNILERFNTQECSSATVKFDRRRAALSDSDDD